jgi:acetyltransferase-like isoleucine patch superfamily enzyme
MRLRARLWPLRHPGITVGSGVRIGRDCRLALDPQARLVLEAGAEIDDGTTLAVYDEGELSFGAGAFVGHHCTIAARESVQIGAGTYLAELVSIRDHDHAVGTPPSAGAMHASPVLIGTNVWIGAKATVLRGAQIGDGAVVGANAVVSGELPARCVAVGVPARVVRMLDEPAALDEPS